METQETGSRTCRGTKCLYPVGGGSAKPHVKGSRSMTLVPLENFTLAVAPLMLLIVPRCQYFLACPGRAISCDVPEGSHAQPARSLGESL